ncbi:MAG: ABC transporter ATP-binding protein [Hyphomicrobiaceae bacterium]
MTNQSVIEIRNVSLNYGPVRALDDVTIEFREGEFFALLGPSGCGKTSLLRIMAGFAEPTSGEILLDGQDLIAVPARKRPINMMFQSYALFPHMTVEGNVRYGLETARLPAAEIKSRVETMLETTHLTDLAERRPNQLSGGQRQRVALARALVMHPRVLLLDEPLGALDKKLREAMQLELKRLQHELGITFIVVTHDQEEALVMADRIALMRGGKFEQIGTPSELYERPASRFVADFVGKTNFFAGTAKGKMVTVVGLGELSCATPSEGPVAYSIRPERIRVSAERPAESDNSFEGEVAEVAYHGQDETVMVRIPGQPDLVIARVNASDPMVPMISVGQRVWLSWSCTDARILPH